MTSLSDRLNRVRNPEGPPPPPTDGATAPSPPPPAPAPAAAPRKLQPVRTDTRANSSVKERVHQALIDSLGPQLYDPHLPEEELANAVRETLQEVIDSEETPLSRADRTRVIQEVSDDILGHGPLEPLLRDPEISEIMVNGPENIFVERSGRLHHAGLQFTSEAHLRRTIDKIVGRIGRRVDEASPMVDARLPDGSRINAVVPPIALDGSLLTIRKFSTDPLTADDLVSFGTLSPASKDFLDACVRGRLNIVISGGTGSGKTTTLNVMSSFVPSDERIVTVEDAAELQLHQEHVLRLESRPDNSEGKGGVTIRDLVRNCLRMRPDRIIVGEVRGGEALDLIKVWGTGHPGGIATLHASSAHGALLRLEQLILEVAMTPPRALIAEAVNVIVFIAGRGRARQVQTVARVTGFDGNGYQLDDALAPLPSPSSTHLGELP